MYKRHKHVVSHALHTHTCLAARLCSRPVHPRHRYIIDDRRILWIPLFTSFQNRPRVLQTITFRNKDMFSMSRFESSNSFKLEKISNVRENRDMILIFR